MLSTIHNQSKQCPENNGNNIPENQHIASEVAYWVIWFSLAKWKVSLQCYFHSNTLDGDKEPILSNAIIAE